MIIETLDGKTYDFDEADIRTMKFLVSSPAPIHNFMRVEGMIGEIDTGTTFGPRDITVSLLIRANNRITFSLMRDEIFEVLLRKEPFFVTHKVQIGKRWLVKVKDSFVIPQKFYSGLFDVQLIAIRGCAESRATTKIINDKGLINEDLFSYGMGLETVDDTELIYVHTGKTFKIFNAGNVEVHPFESDLNIEIKNVQGSSSNFELINRTNNSRFKINKPVASSEVWKINGPVIKRNSLMATRDTAKTFISLEPGWNTFEILGASSATVSFDFKYLYL